MKKKISLIEKIINEYNLMSDTLELYSNGECLHTLLCKKKGNKYCVEIETNVSTTLVWYDMNKKEDVDELLETLKMKYC